MKKPLEKLSVILAIASALSLNLPVNAANKETEGIVRGSYINLRAEPKFNSQIVGKKLRGDTYTIKFEQQNWLKVIFKDNTEGWIYKTLIEATNKDAEENKVNLDDKDPGKPYTAGFFLLSPDVPDPASLTEEVPDNPATSDSNYMHTYNRTSHKIYRNIRNKDSFLRIFLSDSR